jgi:hypothetical protein
VYPPLALRRGKGGGWKGMGWDVDVQTGAAGFMGLMGLRYCLFRARLHVQLLCLGAGTAVEGECERDEDEEGKVLYPIRNASHPAIPSPRWATMLPGCSSCVEAAPGTKGQYSTTETRDRTGTTLL